MKLVMTILILMISVPAQAAEVALPIHAKIIRMVTVEERIAACEDGYQLGCDLLARDGQDAQPDEEPDYPSDVAIVDPGPDPVNFE
jgi:hypothetical protein